MSENSIGLSTDRDKLVTDARHRYFEEANHSIEEVLQNFTPFVRRMQLTRFLAHYELFNMVKKLPGSIVELGVYKGASLFAFANFLEIFCSGDRSRKVIGFDSFEGLSNFSPQDGVDNEMHFKTEGGWKAENFGDNLDKLAQIFQMEAFVPQADRIKLVRGDILETVPKFIDDNPGLRISLLHFDCDLYAPTLEGLKCLAPLVVPGGLVVLDEFAITAWAGETAAVEEFFGRKVEINKFTWTSLPGGYIKL